MVSEHFSGLIGRISGQKSYFWPLCNEISIIEKSQLWRFFMIFSNFVDAIYGRNRPEVAGYTKDCEKCVLETV